MSQFQSLFSSVLRNPKRLFIAILALMLLVMIKMSFDAGISADEFRHRTQAKKVYEYYQSGKKDKSALKNTGIDPMQYNGQSFDNFMYYLEEKFDVDNYMEMRHFFNAIIGWLIILFTGLLVKNLSNYKVGILAITILFFSPRFIGHAVNNNKDIPFALGFIITIYGLVLLLKQLPKISWKPIALVTIGIAFSISIRLAGILGIVILLLFLGVYFFSKVKSKEGTIKSSGKLFLKLTLLGALISIIAFALGISYWPYLTDDPINNMFNVLKATSKHPIKINQVFEGELTMSNELPKYYVLKYMYMSYPLIVLVGFLSYLVFFFKSRKKYNVMGMLVILASILIPLFLISLGNSNIYGGIRHLLFIYPLVVIAATLGLVFLYNSVKGKSKTVHFGMIGVVTLLLLLPIKHTISNYPYAYVYFNELSGGMSAANGNYETDYFQHSLKEATIWLNNNELIDNEPSDTIRVITNAYENVAYYLTEKNTQLEYSRFYEKSSKDWDYAILYCSYIYPEQIRNGNWVIPGTIHTIDVDGVPIAIVVKRKSRDGLNALKALNAKKYQEAEDLFNRYLKGNPNDAEILASVSMMWMERKDYKKALAYAEMSLEIHPNYFNALHAKGVASFFLRDHNTAQMFLDKALSITLQSYTTHFYKGYSLHYLGRFDEALKEIRMALQLNSNFYEGYIVAGDILLNHASNKSNVQGAREFYQAAYNLNPNNPKARIMLAYCGFYENDISLAAEIMQDYSGKDVPFDALKLLIRIRLKENNMQEVQGLLSRVEQINSNSELYFLRAVYWLQMRNISEAQKNLNQALVLFAHNSEAKALKKHLGQITGGFGQ